MGTLRSVLLAGMMAASAASPALPAGKSPAAASAPATAAAAARLRALYFGLDFEGARLEGQRLLAAHSDDPQARAWLVLSLADDRRNQEAIAAAEALRASHPDSPWSWFALAGALGDQPRRAREALRASRWALASMPEDPDAVWLRMRTLNLHGKPDRAVALAEKRRARLADPVNLLVLEGRILYEQAYRAEPRDDGKLARANALFVEARRIAPGDASALYFHGFYLAHYADRHAEAYPLLKKAAEQAPLATTVHREYWWAVMARKDMKKERKHSEIEADLRRLLKARGDSPAVLFAASGMYYQMKRTERHEELQKRLLLIAPDSREAGYVLAGRLEEWEQKAVKGEIKDPRERARYRKALREFIARPEHHSDYSLAWTYRALLRLETYDPTLSADELLETVRAMLRCDTDDPASFYAAGVLALAERGAHSGEAEAIAREGLQKVRDALDLEDWLENGEQRRSVLDYRQARIHDALGWLYFRRARPSDAEHALHHAHELDARMTLNLYHLGRLYEARGEMEEAERFYVEGVVVEDPDENPNLAALKDLYARTRGGSDGFDAWLERATDSDRARRKSEILAARLGEPRPIPAFALQTLDGGRMASDDIQGRITVINFWGMWCGWCMEEMPDIQKLHERYRDDSEVRVLTIDNDRNTDAVRDWMREKKYDFPVLVDEGYVDQAGITGFPHTWFLGRDGRIAFEQLGWSKYLMEEYGWRIEALRDGAGGGE
jgi:thiol-disulfide isomerase/thioredoxin